MSKIKSERAKKLFDDRAKLLNSETSDIYDYYVSTVAVNEIVILAEQDAEERAVKAFEKWVNLRHNNIDKYMNEFKQLLNGGQSNE